MHEQLSVIQRTPEVTKPEVFHNDYVFRIDYAPDTPDAVLQNDVVTYLEEYRLKVQKSHYDLLYTKGNDGQLALRSSDNGGSMVAIGRNAISDRLKNGHSVVKESADLLGMQKIEEYMTDAKAGDTILWASPPDPSVGYDYGFFYVGQVEALQGEGKRLKMAAIRLDNSPALQQFNSALSLLKQEPVAFETVNEFISNPQRIERAVAEQELDFVLKGTFEFQADPKEEAKKLYIKTKIQPYIDTLKLFVKDGASKNILRRMMFALENYTLQLSSEYDQGVSGQTVVYEDASRSLSLGQFIDRHAYVPPKVVGSCDVDSSATSPNTLGYTSIFSPGSFSLGGEQKEWSYTLGECRVCEDKFTQVGPCKICKTCEKKFD